MAWVRPGLQRGYNFVPFFPLTKKIEVNGENENPIFTHLKVLKDQNLAYIIKNFFKNVDLFISLCDILKIISACMSTSLGEILAI